MTFKRFLCFLSWGVVACSSIWLLNGCSAARRNAALISSFGSQVPVSSTGSGGLTAEEEAALAEGTNSEAPPEEEESPEDFTYFPYDLQMDTVAFMGCETASFFSFKMGAYFERSGLRLSEFFLQQVDQINADSLRELIESSTKHLALPYVGFALPTNLVSTLNNTQVHLRLKSFIPDLIKTGTTRLRNLKGIDQIEAELRLGLNSIAYVKEIQHRNYKMLLSYKNEKNKTIHKTGGDWGVDLYGRTYHLEFSEILSAQNVSRYILDTVEEKKLPEEPDQPDWDCHESLRFEIRRHPKNAYDPQKFYDSQSAAFKAEYTLNQALSSRDPRVHIPSGEEICPETAESNSAQGVIARKVLGKYWNINTNRNCISPKSTTDHCYVKSNLTNPQLRKLADRGGEDCEGNTKKYCPHYFSICVRKN